MPGSLDLAIHAPLVRMTALLLLAVLLGGLVGWERQRRESPAGLRTHILVCVGATLITQISSQFGINGDRIAAQIVTGVGFLGAGTILRDTSGTSVRGLTTAASLWAIAGVGIAVGYGGLYAEIAAVTTLIILFTLTLLNTFENVLDRYRKRQDLTVVFGKSDNLLPLVSHLLSLLHERGVRTRDLRIENAAETQSVHLQLRLPHATNRDMIETMLKNREDILHYQWEE